MNALWNYVNELLDEWFLAAKTISASFSGLQKYASREILAPEVQLFELILISYRLLFIL